AGLLNSCLNCVNSIVSICRELVRCVTISFFISSYEGLGLLIIRVCRERCQEHNALCKRGIKSFYCQDTIQSVTSEKVRFNSHAACLSQNQRCLCIVDRQENQPRAG